MPGNDDKLNKRGPYKSRAVLREQARRQADLLADPEVAAFADALRRISDPKKRACLEWLVIELSRDKRERP